MDYICLNCLTEIEGEQSLVLPYIEKPEVCPVCGGTDLQEKEVYDTDAKINAEERD
jgi:DNA-directed RNA polymerase subunit RPC12/RpoP